MSNPVLPPGWNCKVSQEEINSLPLGKWDGAIRIVVDDDSLKKAAETWQDQTLVGFDTETRPAFRKGVIYPPSLIQLAVPEEVILIQLHNIRNFSSIVALFEDHRVVKAGVGLDQDISKLQTVFRFAPAGFVDVSAEAEKVGLPNRGLRNMAAVQLGLRISKRAKCSNWAKDELKLFQILYAATDAWISRELYLSLRQHHLLSGMAGSS